MKRATLERRAEELAVRHGLPADSGARLLTLTRALAAEPDPPTTIRAADEILARHVADSLAGLDLPALRAEADRIADIGSGAGFPGLALALALPGTAVDLIEASRRRCQVIERLARSAGAPNARVVPERVETWAAGEGREAYGAVTARAVASLPVLVEYAAPLLRLGGALVAWKGRRDPDEEHAGETAASELGLDYAEVVAVQPFPAAQDRHLHLFNKRQPTPPRFPRRAGRAAKRPLGY